VKKFIERIAFLVLPSEWVYDLERWRRIESLEKERQKVKHLDGGGSKFKYTLEPFKKNNTIFVHIPKCAGVSISIGLFDCLAGAHKSVRHYRLLFGRDFWQYFKFTFVRHPYSRLVSAYRYITQNDHDIWSENKSTKRKINSSFRDFDDFVLNGLRQLSEEDCHFRPQSRYLLLGDTVAVDYIGRIERIHRDFNNVCNILDVSQELPRLNDTGNNYTTRSYYTSDAVKRRVDQIYSEDFERLGYVPDLSEVN